MAVLAAVLMLGMAPVVAQEGPRLFGVEGAPATNKQDNVGIIVTASPEVVNNVCMEGAPTVPFGSVILACTNTKKRTILMPNPCLYEDVDPYARLLCHEMAHLDQPDGTPGWKHAE